MLHPVRVGAGLFLELAVGASERLFAGLQHAGRYLPHRALRGVAVLAQEQYPRVGVRGRREERYHGRRAGMSHDLQFERRPVRTANRIHRPLVSRRPP